MMEISGIIKRGSTDWEFFSISSHLDFYEVDFGTIPTAATTYPLSNGGKLLFMVSPSEGDDSELWTEGDIKWRLMKPPTKDWPFYEAASDQDIPPIDKQGVESWIKKEISELEKWFA